MNTTPRPSPRRARLTPVLVIAAPVAWAQGVATDAQLERVVVTGEAARSALPASLPAVVTSKSAAQLREQNLFNPEDALQYAPHTTIRKRYPGDRNALIAGRSFGTLQPSRALVYLDGYLISNFLGRFDAPRWNMVSPEAIERVDVLYGPYSALFPGNSIGTTVAVTQRSPRGFEASGRLSGYSQRYSEYGLDDRYEGGQLSLHLADRLESGLWYAFDLNHQDATSQPMQYHTVTADAAGRFSSVSGAATPVTGIRYDTDPKGLRRAVFGASSGAIDHTVQDTLVTRVGMKPTRHLEVQGTAAWWRNDTRTRNVTLLRNAAGSPVWSGAVTDGQNTFNVPTAAFAPSLRDETHRQLGATLKTRRGPGWNTSLVVSDYRILRDTNRQANRPDPEAAQGGSGNVTERDGTGWRTAEVQAAWTPSPGDWGDGRHALSFGLHRNAYRLDNRVRTVGPTADWRAATGELSQSFQGRTEVTALYAQHAWQFAPDWKLTLGWREERFRAFDGSQLAVAQTVTYDDRSLRGHSPKAALVWAVRDDLLLRLSFGRGVRFPNVEELYNGTVTATSQTLSDPNLKPETSDAVELTAEQDWDRHRLRVSLYADRVKDSILRQTTTDAAACQAVAVAATTYTCVQNVDRVRTEGIELSWQAEDFPARGISVDASAAHTFRSEVTANARDPQMVGKWWLRVPRSRAAVQLAWRPDEKWLAAIGYRHQGRAYNDTYNLDILPNVYGGLSSVNQVDLRGAYKVTPQLEVALGLNNVTDQRTYQSHPYPGRTLFLELRFATARVS